MSARSFVHLHVHTEYSMLDGASRVSEVVAAAASDGQPGIGITDHGNMYGVLPMYRAAKDAGITPIIGTELYQAFEHRTERPARRGSQVDDSGGEVEGGRKAYYHLTALAENLTGYRNLIQLSSRAYLEGYYQKPKVDWELLEHHHEGIIATTGCLGGQVLQALLRNDDAGALGDRRAAAGHLRAREPLRRAAGPRHPRPAVDEPEARGDRAQGRRAAARHQRQPLHAPEPTPCRTTPCCACRPAPRSTTRSGSASTATSTT